jgi:LysR family nitrogen assimilation transcriptional regulator
MDLENLKLFVLVAELESISKAAVRSGLGPSTLSRKLAALEAECNGRLLHRTGRGVKLTSLGERILPLARILLDRAAELMHEMGAAANACHGTVHIGCVPALVAPILTKVVALARDRFPGVVIHAVEGYPNQIEQWLVDGKIDLGFLVRRTQEGPEAPLTSARLCLVGPREDRITSLKEVEFKSLDGIPLLQPAAPSSFRAAIADIARQLAVRLNVVAEIDSVQLMKEMAAAGVGYALLSRTAVRRELLTGELSATPIVNPSVIRSIFLGTSPRKTEGRAAKEIAALIRQVSRDLVEAGEWGDEMSGS